MKKIILSCTLLFTAYSLQAQTAITVTTADLPAPGSEYVNIIELNWGGVYAGDPGENQVYDFSGLQNSGEDTVRFLDPGQTAYSSSFPNSTITRFLSSDSSFAFMVESTSKLEIYGLVMTVPMSTEKAIAQASDPLTQFTFPMTYQTSFNDVAAFSTNSIYFHQEISPDPYTYFDSARVNISYDRNSSVDGWGTLMTPFGTSFSVLRQKIDDITTYAPEFYIIYVDTIFGMPVTIPLGWQTIPGAEMTDTTTTYYYLANTDSGFPMILAQVDEDVNGSVTNVEYAKLPYAAIKELSVSNVFLFPNPATDHVELKSPVQLSHVTMLSPDGKQVFATDIHSNSVNIDLSGYATGLYTLIIDTEKGQEVKRVNKL